MADADAVVTAAWEKVERIAVELYGADGVDITPAAAKSVKDDVVAGAENIIVVMTHASKDGESKLLERCSLPLTGAGCIRTVLTDLAWLEIDNGAFILRERAPGVSIEEIVAKTAGKLIVPDQVPEMQF